MTPTENSNVCAEGGQRLVGSFTSSLTSVIFAIMPKCGACVIAYSGTMAMCGNGITVETFHRSSSGISVWLAVFLSVLTLASVLLNRRGIRTYVAVILILLGSGLSLTSMIEGGGPALYFSGAALMFSGVWTNASLISVFRQLFGRRASSCSIMSNQ